MAKKKKTLLAKIVIIADDARNAVLLKLWLEGKGYYCIIVDTEEESEPLSRDNNVVGIFYATEFRFDFINGGLSAHHVYEDSARTRSHRLREGVSAR